MSHFCRTGGGRHAETGQACGSPIDSGKRNAYNVDIKQERVNTMLFMPISLPGLATVGILAFLFCWNEFLIPLVLITKSEMKMLSQGIQDLNGQYVSELGVMFAGVVMMALPVVVVYLIFQEQVIRGMVAGAVKG